MFRESFIYIIISFTYYFNIFFIFRGVEINNKYTLKEKIIFFINTKNFIKKLYIWNILYIKLILNEEKMY